MMALTMSADPTNCTTLSAIFPPVKNNTIPPVFTPAAGNYTCFERRNASSVSALGEVDSTWCIHTINISMWLNATSMVWARADLFWYCGTNILYLQLPSYWSGVCAMVRLGLPLLLLGHVQNHTHTIRTKRSTPFSFDSTSSTTYFDAIGVPRGVPDEYKLVNQIAAGFESLPIIGAVFPVTPNKNVDRINYVHYNILRLANATRDAVAGLSEQLAATSLMTVQNRMALDMLLAEKGGVCSMFGDQCCTYIPNNTAPDGSVTRALEGLRTLSIEMHENSGIDSSLNGLLESWFGKWKSTVVSVLLSLTGMMCALALCGCCCVPCIRSLCNRIIIAAVEKSEPPPPYQLPLFFWDRSSVALETTEWTDQEEDEV